MKEELNQIPVPPIVTSTGVINTNEKIVSETVLEELKPYILRKLKAKELFPILNIFKKIGFERFKCFLQKQEVVDLFNKIRNKKTGEIAEDELVGVGSLAIETVQIILEGTAECENELFTILSNVSNLTIDEVKELDLDVLIGMIVDLIKENKDFIKAVSKYFK